MTEREAGTRHPSEHLMEIFLGGVPPLITTDLAKLEAQAAATLSAEAYGYIVANAGNGATARANRAAFDRWRLVPRMLRGVDKRNLGCEVLGTSMPAPIMIAPVGVQTLAHPEGELATVRAAAKLGIPYIHSAAAAHSFEEVAEAGGDAPRWFQLYCVTDGDVHASFLRRAKAAGFSTLVVTVDTPMLGWRPSDINRAFQPFLRGLGLANYTSDPAFRAKLPESSDAGVAAATHWAGMFPNPGLTWDGLSFLRRHWDGPVLLKGICAVDDARRAADAGFDGIVVSNHGGRQLDGAVAALDVLPEIADAVGSRMTVLFDSGVRTGVDVAKALALGARAVLLGRSFLYGLALDGQAGVEHVLRCTLAELDLTAALSGHAGHQELSPASMVFR
ncbi:alpha-hydroxy-acid oxidizing protein [Nonomuraea sp. NPDC005650]|uniref:alpha-hydroxy-acid oxidizing protein n=1 Tax=Nonomuraea sp. NPDC005650 TaxID=3157045 RepID=UPI0033AAC48F